MGPKKWKTVRDLHNETIQAQRLSPVVKDSGVDRLDKKNKAFLAAKRRREIEDDGDDGETSIEALVHKAARSNKKKSVLKEKQPEATADTHTKKTPKKNVVVPFEAWCPAGGEDSSEYQESNEPATGKLGITRLPTWKVEKFTKDLKDLISKHGLVAELMTQEIIIDDESLTDVFAGLESEEAAQECMREIDGEMLEGRILKVKSA